MSLVFSQLTQHDALNKVTIAADMRQDSGSMKSVGVLTMLFLPGTFSAAIFGVVFFLPLLARM